MWDFERNSIVHFLHLCFMCVLSKPSVEFGSQLLSLSASSARVVHCLLGRRTMSTQNCIN